MMRRNPKQPHIHVGNGTILIGDGFLCQKEDVWCSVFAIIAIERIFLSIIGEEIGDWCRISKEDTGKKQKLKIC